MFSKILKKKLFYYYFVLSKYHQALAKRDDDELSCRHYIWALYQLSIFETIVSTPYVGNHWRGLFAKTVSLAACGREADAKKVLNKFKLSKVFNRKRNLLAQALAPFSAQLALDVLKNDQADPLFCVALLLKLNRREDAARVIATMEDSKINATNSEVYLLNANAKIAEFSPMQHLESMNRFLAVYSLPPVFLINKSLPPNVTNIQAAGGMPMISGPLVSVLMTAYNSAKFITSTIESLLRQTYQNIEIIIVDDASDDNTIEVVQQLAQKDARIKCFSLPCNAGTFVAKTIALKYSKGEFVTCHDSDDWSHPLRIQRQVEPLLKNKRLIATTSCWVRIEQDGQFYARQVYPLMRLNPASPLFRRDKVLTHAGAWDIVKTGADSEFIARLRLVFGGAAIKQIIEPLGFGAHRPGSLMTASDTGYTHDGVTNGRLAYWDAWMHWHINTLRKGRLPKLSSELTADRVFPAPKSVSIPRYKIDMCLEVKDYLS